MSLSLQQNRLILLQFIRCTEHLPSPTMPHLPTRNRSYNTNLNYAPSHLATNLPSTSTTPPHQPPPIKRTRLRLKQTAVKEQKSTGQVRHLPHPTTATTQPPTLGTIPSLARKPPQTHEETRAPRPAAERQRAHDPIAQAPQRTLEQSAPFISRTAPSLRRQHGAIIIRLGLLQPPGALQKIAQRSRSLARSFHPRRRNPAEAERASEALSAEKAD